MSDEEIFLIGLGIVIGVVLMALIVLIVMSLAILL